MDLKRRVGKSIIPAFIVIAFFHPAKQSFIAFCVLMNDQWGKAAFFCDKANISIDMAFPVPVCFNHRTGEKEPRCLRTEQRMISCLPAQRIAQNFGANGIFTGDEMISQIQRVSVPDFPVSFVRPDFNQLAV